MMLMSRTWLHNSHLLLFSYDYFVMEALLDITILSWNIRGTHNNNARRHLKELMRKHNPTFMAIYERVEDTIIWNQNINGVYTAKSGYSWLLCNSESDTNPSSTFTWSWIWKLKIHEKLLVWLTCHNAVPTLSLLHHYHIAPSTTFSRCGDDDETILHCLHDCRFSSHI